MSRDRLLLIATVMIAILVGSVTLAGAGDATKSAAGGKTVKKLKRKVASLEDRVAALESRAATPGPAGPPGPPGQPGQDATAPAGAVAFFALASCPSGWTEFTLARGRYIVGLPAGGTLGGIAGTALSNVENRPVGQHNHGITDPGHVHPFNLGVGLADSALDTEILDQAQIQTFTSGRTTGSNTTGITINNAGSVSGTNAPYIQLLACGKT